MPSCIARAPLGQMGYEQTCQRLSTDGTFHFSSRSILRALALGAGPIAPGLLCRSLGLDLLGEPATVREIWFDEQGTVIEGGEDLELGVDVDKFRHDGIGDRKLNVHDPILLVF